MGAAPALAEGTAAIEPAGKAERAPATKSEVSIPRTKGEAKHEVDAPLQGIPNEGKPCSKRKAP